MKKVQRRYGGSIRTRAIVTQVILIILPVILCTFLLIQQLTSDSAVHNAGVTYQYDRYIVDSLDTACRQMESMANTIAANRFVREYTAMEDGAKRNQLFQDRIDGLLKYSYNRYLPTHNVEIIPGISLEELPLDTQLHRYFRSEFRMWTFEINEGVPNGCFYYQFEGDSGKPGVLVFRPTATMLSDIAERIAAINNQSCALLGTDGAMLFLPASVAEQEKAILTENDAGMTEGYQILNDRRIRYRVQSEVLPVVFVSVQPMTDILHASERLIPVLLISLLLIVLYSYVSFRVFFNGITKRIIKLSEACESLTLDRIGAGDPMNYSPTEQAALPSVRVEGNDEIGMLAQSINDMLRRISDLSIQNAQEVRTSQRTAYDMLAAQIHPHFIYNTLENLRMMAEINDDPQVADQLYALGRMLRLSISDASSTGEVSMEIEHAEMYLQLQKLRMNDQLQYEIAPIEADILRVKCPRFLLQPLVENALKHGFQKKATPGHIWITAGWYEKGIWLKVKNDGEGFSPDRLQEVREALRYNHPIENAKGGIGLVNVNTRLKMFYGNEAGMTIDSTPETGTACTLWLVTDASSTHPETYRA